MADIRVTSTGRDFYHVDDAIAQILCEAFPESFQRLRQPTKPAGPSGLVFQLSQTISGEVYIHASCPACHQVFRITNYAPHGTAGMPGQRGKSAAQAAEDSARGCGNLSHCGRNESVPEEMVKKFRQAHEE